MPQATIQKPVNSTLDAIGNTPLVKLSKVTLHPTAPMSM